MSQLGRHDLALSLKIKHYTPGSTHVVGLGSRVGLFYWGCKCDYKFFAFALNFAQKKTVLEGFSVDQNEKF